MEKKIHLICNAHLDPVWLWQWEDGLAETLSTFRIAADFCEENSGFVFNHNEMRLYSWIEEYDPVLFRRIQKLVCEGKWHIAGGSFIQPDINNVSGESNIRQFLTAKNYFRAKFGVEPTTAYNFDPFGQPEGYPQILQGCGFDSYIFCRPGTPEWDLPIGSFLWEDRSGSRVVARRSDDHYLTNGKIYEALEEWLKYYKDEPETMILWGIGNHGGGISREEYAELQRFIADHGDKYEVIHSTPEMFFEGVTGKSDLPVVCGEMENNFPGCYSSMARVKQAHRKVENLMAVTERLAANSWLTGKADYPEDELTEAWKDIMFLEFHDILPGSGIKEVEHDALKLAGHAEEILRRVKLRGMVAMLTDTAAPQASGAVPIFVWNPHGKEVETVVEVEYNVAHLQSPRHTAEISLLDEHGNKVLFQREKEAANVTVDWRIRICFPVTLPPFGFRRFEAVFTEVEQTAGLPVTKLVKDSFEFTSEAFSLKLNPITGLVDAFIPSGSTESLIEEGSFRPLIFADLDHSWTCGSPRKFKSAKPGTENSALPWGEPIDEFYPANSDELMALFQAPDGGRELTSPVSIVEDGPVRTVIEAVFCCRSSYIVRHYILDKTPANFSIEDYVVWNEKDCMLKLEIPLAFKLDGVQTDAIYSAIYRNVPESHQDFTGQRWIAARESKADGKYFSCVSDSISAHSFGGGNSMYLSLLRSPVYSSFGLSNNLPEYNERFLVRHDQGEHVFRYGFGGGTEFNETTVQKASDLFNMPPECKVFFPDGRGQDMVPSQALEISVDNVTLCAMKKAEESDDLIVRFRENGGTDTDFSFTLPGDTKRHNLKIKAWSLLTISIKGGTCREVNLIEQ